MLTGQLEELQRELKNCEDAFIVEGIKDKKALIGLGFKNIIDISGKPLYKLLEEVKASEFKSVVILSDFDEEGKKKALALTKLFQSSGIKINSFTRNKIKSLFKIPKIEELNSFTKIMEDDYYGKNCSVYDKILNRSRILSRRISRKARRDRSHIRPDRRIVRA